MEVVEEYLKLQLSVNLNNCCFGCFSFCMFRLGYTEFLADNGFVHSDFDVGHADFAHSAIDRCCFGGHIDF